MPVESELDRRLRGTEAGGGGKVNPTASGKKRKKKKKEKSETGGAKIAAREEAREAGQVLKRKDSGKILGAYLTATCHSYLHIREKSGSRGFQKGQPNRLLCLAQRQ